MTVGWKLRTVAGVDERNLGLARGPGESQHDVEAKPGDERQNALDGLGVLAP